MGKSERETEKKRARERASDDRGGGWMDGWVPVPAEASPQGAACVEEVVYAMGMGIRAMPCHIMRHGGMAWHPSCPEPKIK